MLDRLHTQHKSYPTIVHCFVTCRVV